MDLQKICDDVECEWQAGGLSDGIYCDYAKEVARRAVEIEREECAKVCEAVRTIAKMLNQREAECTAAECADDIRTRSNTE